jgi:hypothetical protein
VLRPEWRTLVLSLWPSFFSRKIQHTWKRRKVTDREEGEGGGEEEEKGEGGGEEGGEEEGGEEEGGEGGGEEEGEEEDEDETGMIMKSLEN